MSWQEEMKELVQKHAKKETEPKPKKQATTQEARNNPRAPHNQPFQWRRQKAEKE